MKLYSGSALTMIDMLIRCTELIGWQSARLFVCILFVYEIVITYSRGYSKLITLSFRRRVIVITVHRCYRARTLFMWGGLCFSKYCHIPSSRSYFG